MGADLQSMDADPALEAYPANAEQRPSKRARKTDSSRPCRKTQPGTNVSAAVSAPAPRPKLADIYGKATLSEVFGTRPGGLDIQQYVDRSAGDRQAELRRSRDGKVKRPLNSFMLYRKAYHAALREGAPGTTENNQAVSCLVAESWRVESPEVRGTFADWAETEKRNHLAAFPDYSYNPGRKRPRADSTSDSILADLDVE
ncbi:hypothetical protein GGR56DRAFT_675615 [Xylariaceae sp. FL0804]|nr:hypothetical protein GGR56DRAFT_675615 [Xylariaceae sp. FL0804]